MATITQTHEEREAVLAAAIQYLAAGLNVLRIGNEKRPSIPDTPGHKWEELQETRATEERVQKWYDNAEEFGLPAGVGVVCGRVSGNLWVLDFDLEADEIYPQWRALLAERYPELAAALDAAPVARTSKGYHVYMRLPEARPNELLAGYPKVVDGRRKVGVLIETRGEGGYVVAPPSPHPSGARYQWIRPLEGPIPLLSAELVEQLLEASRSFDRRPHERLQATAAARPSVKQTGTETRPHGDKPTIEEIREMLRYIPETTYEEWVSVLMAVHSVYPEEGGEGEAACREWREWEPGEVARKWKTFKKDAGGVGIGTLVLMAKQGGYKPPKREPPAGSAAVPTQSPRPHEPAPLAIGTQSPREIVLVDNPETAERLNAAGLSMRAVGLEGGPLTREQAAALHSNGVELVVVATRPESVEEALRALFRAKVEGLLVAQTLEAQSLAAVEESLRDAVRAGVWLVKHLLTGVELPLSDLEEERLLGRFASLHAWLEEREPLQAEALLAELCSRLDIRYEEIRPRLERAGERKAQEERQATVDSLLHGAAAANAAGDTNRAQELTDTAARVMSSGYVALPRPYTLADLENDLLNEPESIRLPWDELSGVKIPRAGLSVIAADSGIGKTTLMLNLVVQFLHYRELREESIYFFTYEEPTIHIAVKLLILLSGVELHKEQNFEAFKSYMRARRSTSPYPTDEDKRARIEEAIRRYEHATAAGRLVIVDTMPRVDELVSTLERIARSARAAVVFIDYVQIIPHVDKATKQLEIANTVQKLRTTAVRNKLAIITGSQVTDGLTREARDIFHEAQVVLQLSLDSAQGPGVLRVSVDKQRSGVSRISKLLDFDRPTLRIASRSGGAAAPVRREVVEEADRAR